MMDQEAWDRLKALIEHNAKDLENEITRLKGRLDETHTTLSAMRQIETQAKTRGPQS